MPNPRKMGAARRMRRRKRRHNPESGAGPAPGPRFLYPNPILRRRAMKKRVRLIITEYLRDRDEVREEILPADEAFERAATAILAFLAMEWLSWTQKNDGRPWEWRSDDGRLRVLIVPPSDSSSKSAAVIRDVDNDLDLVRIVDVPEWADDALILRAAERAGLLEHGLYEEAPRGTLSVVREDAAGREDPDVPTVSWADIPPVRIFVRGPDPAQWQHDVVPAREAAEAIVEAINEHLGLEHWPPEELAADDAEAIRSLVEREAGGEWECPCGQFRLQWEIP
jgi:hypothetical protein